MGCLLMINKAKEYIGIGHDGKVRLMEYYNRKCYPYVASDRKYKIQPSDDWCAMFTTVIANMSGLGAERFPYEVSVWYQCEWAKRKGLYFTDMSKAQPNDLIIYDWKKGNRYNHTGFIISNENGIIKTIEGNKDKTVAYRVVNASSSSVRGFIRIDYKADVPRDSDHIALQALRTVLGRYGNGHERRNALGSDFKAVQDLINKL